MIQFKIFKLMPKGRYNHLMQLEEREINLFQQSNLTPKQEASTGL